MSSVVVQLHDQVDELKSALGTKLDDLPIIPGVKLAKKEREFLGLLLKRDRVHREVVWSVLYSDVPVDGRPKIESLHVYVCTLRKKLGPLNIEIKSDRGEDTWHIPLDSKERAKMLMSGGPVPKKAVPRTLQSFVIEKGIPVPSTHGGRAGTMYPFPSMEPGDSFFYTGVKTHTVRNSAAGWKKKNDSKWTFIVRDDIKDGVNGVRCWRAK